MYTNNKRLELMKKVLDSTINLEISRWNSHPDYHWIDLKLDAIDNQNHFEDLEGIRGRDNIYCWIQGRGLEALVTHIKWYESLKDTSKPNLESMKNMAREVSASLLKAKKINNGHLYFRLSENGSAKTKPQSEKYTMSDLFCSRGLYAYALAYGTEEEKAQAKDYLVCALKSVIEFNFYDDVESFYSGRAVTYNDGRTTFSGNMIALGGASLLIKGGAVREGLTIGKALIDYVFDNHLNLRDDGCSKWDTISRYTVVDWIMNTEPARCSNNEVQLNPGHSIEFIGLTAQLLLEAYKHPNEIKDFVPWMDSVSKLLIPIIKANFEHGYRKPCGMAMLIDAETNEVINDNMAWWGIPETMRALVLSSKLSDNVDSWIMDTFDMCLEGFIKWYYNQSKSGIAVQTINSKGIPQAVIPATPDLDPGYHTGLSFIGCYCVLNNIKE